jgi:hypothetical protein
VSCGSNQRHKLGILVYSQVVQSSQCWVSHSPSNHHRLHGVPVAALLITGQPHGSIAFLTVHHMACTVSAKHTTIHISLARHVEHCWTHHDHVQTTSDSIRVQSGMCISQHGDVGGGCFQGVHISICYDDSCNQAIPDQVVLAGLGIHTYMIGCITVKRVCPALVAGGGCRQTIDTHMPMQYIPIVPPFHTPPYNR